GRIRPAANSDPRSLYRRLPSANMAVSRGFTTAAPHASHLLELPDQTKWKTTARLGAAASTSHSRRARRLHRLREAERFSMGHMHNRKPCDVAQAIALGSARDHSDSFRAAWHLR